MIFSVFLKACRRCALIFLALAPAARAQEATALPSYNPINPVAQARSGIYAPAPVAPGPGWRWSASLDYASLIEYNIVGVTDRYLLDAEISRVSLSVGRDISPRYFIEASASVGNAESGFMDGLFNWFHDLLGLNIPEREIRPLDVFAYRMNLPDGSAQTWKSGTQLGDLRLSVGRRHNPGFQTLLSATIPTGTGGSGYARGVPSISAITTVLTPVVGRLSYQGSAGVGYTPSHGDLSRYQREFFGSATSGLSFRIWGNQSLYAQVLYHTPYYAGTTFRALDRADVALRYGWTLRAAGRTWLIGMTEDLVPGGPAVDAIFEFGVSTQ